MSDASHTPYKRDQVERAIAIASHIGSPDRDARFAPLRIELKRLLDRDRKQESETPRGRPARRAFHSAPPPGRGIDVMYTGYEAYALLIAMRLLRSGLTQARAVAFMSALRAPLAGFHYETLRESSAKLRSDVDATERPNLVRDGVLVDDPTKMAYLVALAGERAEAFDAPSSAERPVSGNICRSLDDLVHRMRWASHEGHALIVIELVNAAHQLAYHLDRIPPRSRGRG